MKTSKGKLPKASDTEKALARPGVAISQKVNNDHPSEISLDTIIAEKDEVKNAEENFRKKVNKEK